MKREQLSAKIRQANDRLTAAELGLADVLQQLKAAPQVEKVMVAEGFQRALEAIRAARQDILDLDAVVATEIIEP